MLKVKSERDYLENYLQNGTFMYLLQIFNSLSIVRSSKLARNNLQILTNHRDFNLNSLDALQTRRRISCTRTLALRFRFSLGLNNENLPKRPVTQGPARNSSSFKITQEQGRANIAESGAAWFVFTRLRAPLFRSAANFPAGTKHQRKTARDG